MRDGGSLASRGGERGGRWGWRQAHCRGLARTLKGSLRWEWDSVRGIVPSLNAGDVDEGRRKGERRGVFMDLDSPLGTLLWRVSIVFFSIQGSYCSLQ